MYALGTGGRAETGAQDAALVGFSIGSGEVVRSMSRHTGRGVACAALISSVVPYMLKTDSSPAGVGQAVFDQMTAGMKEDRPMFFAGFFKQFYGVGLMAHPVSDEPLEWSRNVAMQAGLLATLECAKAFATTDFRGELAALTVPMLIVHGTADKTVPIGATGRAVARALPQARLVEYDGAPHGVLATHKRQVTSDLLAFLGAETS